MARGPPEIPVGATGGPEGLSGYDRGSQEPVRSSQGHSGTVRTTSGQYEYVLVYSGTSFSFVNISALYNSTKLVRYLKFTYRSQFSEEKNSLEICFLVPEILNKQDLVFSVKL